MKTLLFLISILGLAVASPVSELNCNKKLITTEINCLHLLDVNSLNKLDDQVVRSGAKLQNGSFRKNMGK